MPLNNNKFIAVTYPDELPISELKDDIVQSIRENQVLVIAGDTGSGKTTQIPKMCMEAGRGSKGMIGCTQPRRIAAISMSERVTEELAVPGAVGYKIRFNDRTSADTLIKFMTDGVLLAETARDRILRQYDTIIIDEAHERSLNIDFLLGYLKTLLQRRPDLKLIIASATIDTEKFSRHFNNAPIIAVPGRVHPITVLYKPLEDETDEDASHVDQAVREVLTITTEKGPGDILVFMPTERDILDCVDALEKQLTTQALILPLFGRLRGADQRRIFQPISRRKIIVATNVAETSITVPGIRFVVDTGLARQARYNARSHTNSLLVSRVSQASCDQRTGRGGRTGPGVCIRLYSEEDYLGRSKFTTPEIQRSNLAEVILRMISLGLGDPRDFPFIDPPASRSINDGYNILHELGAISAQNTLTERGKIMARLPLDPRISRIIIEGANLGALKEVKIITAALSIMDPRVRPLDQENKADEAHRRFADETSDFLTYLNIWNTYHETESKVVSKSRLRKFCKSHFLSWQRMREWLDIHEQINKLLKGIKGFADNDQTAPAASIHQAITCGFLRNIGQKKEKNIYQISGGREAMLFPGSALFNRGGPWIVAADFVETSRLFARTVADIDGQWLERIGGDLCRKSWSDPHWEKKSGQVVALEKVTLFGMIIVAGRRVNYGRTGKAAQREAREIFIRAALIEGQLGSNYDFLRHNLELINRLEKMEDRLRRRGIAVDEQVLYDFYDQRLGNIYDRFTLNRLLKKKKNDSFLHMSEEDIRNREPAPEELYRFPQTLRAGDVELPLRYRFEPGRDDDGITVDIPAALAAGLNPNVFEWLVPGLLEEKILYLLKGLPKTLRRGLVPLPDTAEKILDSLDIYNGSLYPAMERALLKVARTTIRRGDWRTENLPLHLKMRFRLRNEKGKVLYTGRAYQDMLQQAQGAEQIATAPVKKLSLPEKKGITGWDFADISAAVPVRNRQGRVTRQYFPALFINEQDRSLTLRYVDDAEKCARLNRAGTRFLYCLQFPKESKAVTKECKAALISHSASWLTLGAGASSKQLAQLLTDFIMDDLFAIQGNTIPSKDEFARVIDKIRAQGLSRPTNKMLIHILGLLVERREALSAISAWAERAKKHKNFSEQQFNEYQKHLAEVLPRDFLQTRRFADLQHTGRYLRALTLRVTRAEHSPTKDAQKAERLKPFIRAPRHLANQEEISLICEQTWREYQQMVQEFRVSIFAPELGTAMPVSEKRLQKKWREVEDTCQRVE